MAKMRKAAQFSWQLQESPLKDLPVPIEIAVDLLSTCIQLNFDHPRTTVAFVPETWEEYAELPPSQNTTALQQKWQALVASAMPPSLPDQMVPIWKNNRQLMDMHGEACWLDLPYRTLDTFATLLDSEKLLYEGKCTNSCTKATRLRDLFGHPRLLYV